ncbi:unnamed protein product [Linum trigynum]|uniref:Uncharacterized protein n=1 Tax=Linum trigynum TaxID=586398 RepID=A0AAV2GKY1_9ROSI
MRPKKKQRVEMESIDYWNCRMEKSRMSTRKTRVRISFSLEHLAAIPAEEAFTNRQIRQIPPPPIQLGSPQPDALAIDHPEDLYYERRGEAAVVVDASPKPNC